MLTDLHILLSLLLFYSHFCRAVRTDYRTQLPILVSFYVLTAASIFSLFAPLVLHNWHPSPVTVSLLFGILVVEVVTAKYRFYGLPENQNHDDDGKNRREMG